jgi:hypothetical protein
MNDVVAQNGRKRKCFVGIAVVATAKAYHWIALPISAMAIFPIRVYPC